MGIAGRTQGMVGALCAVALLNPPQEADRSGEAQLKEMVLSVGRARSVHIAVSRSRIEDGNTLPEEAVFWIDFVEPGRFRILNNGVFGDSELWVCDSKKLMRDRLEGDTVEVGDAPRSFLAAGSPLQVGQGLPLVCALLDGEAGYASLVAKAGPVKAASAGASTVFSFPVAGGGQAQVEALKQGSEWHVVSTEFVNEAQSGGGGFRGRQGTLRDMVVEWGPLREKTPWVATPPPGTTAVPFGQGRRFGG